MASQIAGVSSVCSAVYSGVDQIKHQSSASLAFVRGIHRRPVDFQLFYRRYMNSRIFILKSSEASRPFSVTRGIYVFNYWVILEKILAMHK